MIIKTTDPDATGIAITGTPADAAAGVLGAVYSIKYSDGCLSVAGVTTCGRPIYKEPPVPLPQPVPCPIHPINVVVLFPELTPAAALARGYAEPYQAGLWTFKVWTLHGSSYTTPPPDAPWAEIASYINSPFYFDIDCYDLLTAIAPLIVGESWWLTVTYKGPGGVWTWSQNAERTDVTEVPE